MIPRELRAPIAPQAWRISAVLLALSFLALLPGWPLIACVALVLAAANLAFFRNPPRAIPPGESNVVAPADGRVVEIAKLDDPDGFVGPAWRIAIFLSVLDVHINRVPISGRVCAVRRAGGSFRAAFKSEASQQNVRLRLDLEGANGLRAAVIQITGLIARRIVCYASEGGTLRRGEPYGLICYGSRAEIYLPVQSTIVVREGQRVRGGESVIAELPA